MGGMTRRQCLVGTSAALAAIGLPPVVTGAAFGAGFAPETGAGADLTDFPAQNRSLVRDMVGAAHGRLERVAELLKDMPQLANATWDHGFGDWETALGAASHVGNREIAAMLMEHGARPDLFTHAMLGNLSAVRATIEAMPGIQKTRGPHGLTLAHHARAGGEASAAVVAYLASIEGADDGYAGVDLSEEAREKYLGNYRFGPGETDIIEVKYQEKQRVVSLTRVGGTWRGLTYLGAHTFHPVGAEDVRIVFGFRNGEASPASGLEIMATKPTVIATRV
jgi:hypothetical protein